MRFRTLEIRWHDSKPISSCDFQPVPTFKKARPANGEGFEDRWPSQTYRLATAGEDNHVRVWMVYPNLHPRRPEQADTDAPTDTPTSRPPRVEYLATLSRHSAAVNVVRWSPSGELIASAGDDGMVVIWSPTSTPQTSTYGSDLSPEELQNEKEFWRVRCMFRCTTMQVYDLAWSPTGEYLITGSTDNVARVFQSADGKCVHEIAEHNHFVQGVSWDPLNEYIATQSSDRSMHVYKISTPTSSGNKHGTFEAHAVGRNSNIHVNVGASGTIRSGRRHGRTPSTMGEPRAPSAARGRTGARPEMTRRESVVSDVESTVSEVGSRDNVFDSKESGLLTPSTSVASTPLFPPTVANSMFPPPPIDKEKQQQQQPSSRRSSFSGSQAPSSPAFSISSRYARSPSPMPALPAIRTAAPRQQDDRWKQVGLYGDESYTNFFRRLTFSPDGGLLITPAGQFEDPEVVTKTEEGQRGRKARPTILTDPSSAVDKNSCVYIYTRANFASPPVAQLPGFQKASVAVKFNPVLFQLRQGVSSGESRVPKSAAIGKGIEGSLNVDLLAPPTSTTPHHHQGPTSASPVKPHIVAPAPMQGSWSSSTTDIASETTSPMTATSAPSMQPPTPATSKPSTPMPTPLPTPHSALTTGSVFALPYRMLFAVETMDTVAIYDTQQAGPFCMLTKLHYDEFTDLSWSPDGQCLLLSSRDGYCTLVMFDEIMPAHHTQQQSLQFQSIAHQHSVPITTSATQSPHVQRSTDVTPSATPMVGLSPLPRTGPVGFGGGAEGADVMPNPGAHGHAEKRARPAESSSAGEGQQPQQPPEVEPPKKKRRVALTRVEDV